MMVVGSRGGLLAIGALGLAAAIVMTMAATAFRRLQKRLRAQDGQRRQLMADIAHELRTPLAVIQGRLEGLLDGVYARDDAQLEGLLNDARLLARLVEDLRTLATAESGALSLQKEPTDLALLIHDAIRAAAPAATERHVSLTANELPDLPVVEIDPLRIREVLTNLLANAIRHTGAGGKVTVSALAAFSRVTVTVRDNGAGIPAQDLPRIFNRFQKGSESTGSGLGLTIAKGLVTAHGGDIRAESQEGSGTAITFTLPV
jgi:two-component system OmpR family sensor kinase/two-component system sensor histidine kinase BaeS